MGPLEREAMQILWSAEELSVREVMQRLPAKRAYTTVMTTMARLFTKGLLKRRAQHRKFLYSPRLTIEKWQQQAARAAAARFLATLDVPRELLVSCLLAAVARGGREDLRSSAQRSGQRPRGTNYIPKNTTIRTLRTEGSEQKRSQPRAKAG